MSIYTKEENDFLVKIGQITKDGASAASNPTTTTEATKAEDK